METPGDMELDGAKIALKRQDCQGQTPTIKLRKKFHSGKTVSGMTLSEGKVKLKIILI